MTHPFFWSSEKRLNFLVDVSDHFEWEPREPPSPDLQVLEDAAPHVLGTDFLRRLDKGFVETLGKQRKYTGSKMLDLLRALRNKVRPLIIGPSFFFPFLPLLHSVFLVPTHPLFWFKIIATRQLQLVKSMIRYIGHLL